MLQSKSISHNLFLYRAVGNAIFDAFLLEFTTSVVLSLCVGDITEVMNSNGCCVSRTSLNFYNEEKYIMGTRRKFFGFTIIILCLTAFSVQAEYRTNPFTSYNRQIEFIEKQLANAGEKQKAGIQKRLDDVKKQKAKAVAKRKKPYLRQIKDLEKFLKTAKSDSKKSSLKTRIQRAQGEINRIDAYAGGASKYDVDKKDIDKFKNSENKGKKPIKTD